MSHALEGIRVLEIGADVAVRYIGRLFAAHGAAVIRCAPGSMAEIGFSGAAGEAYGRWLDAGKSEAKAPDGAFDVIVAGQTAEALEIGVQHQARLGGVLVAMSWFDPGAAYARWTATDEIIAALTGAAFSFGELGGSPTLAQGHAPQLTAGVVAFNAALAALLAPAQRRAQRIDVNVLEAAMCYSETAALSGARSGTRSLRLGVNRYVPTYPCSPYEAADGWVGVTCLTPAQWRALCGLIDRQDLAGDPRFATAFERLMIADEVDAALAPALRRKTQAEWVRLGMDHRIPIAPMVHPGRLPEVEHWRARGAFAAFDASGVLAPTLPYRMTFDGAAAPRRSSASVDHGPLSGIRVVDFGMGWAGPLCTRTLGDLGADVVKIESDGHPDWWRGWESGSVDGSTREMQINFISVNRNKRGVNLDLTHSEGLSQAKALIADADVVVENYAAGVLNKLGLGQAVQRALRPGLISVSMPAFGNGGPLSGIRAYGSTVEQASGLPFVNGEAHWTPAQQHVAFGDPIAGLYAAGAVLVALHARERLGGADIDLAQVACLFQLGADAIISEQLAGTPVARTGSARPRLPLCAIVATKGDDAWLAVATPDRDRLEALSATIGGRDRAALETWAANQSASAAAERLQAVGVAAAPVASPHALAGDPQLQSTGFFADMDRAFIGNHQVAASPFRFDGVRPGLWRPAPTLGEHTAEVIAELHAGPPRS